MIDITKIILLIISITSFVGLILYVIRSFNSTCGDKTHFDKKLNRCVEDCPSPQINDIDGSCVCPNPNEQYVGGMCVPICPKDKPKLCSGTNQCYSEVQQTCINDKILCDSARVCGDECCNPENGQPTTCSNGDIIFKSSDSFTVVEGNSINTKIDVTAGKYSTTDIGADNYYPSVLGRLLTNASESAGNNYSYKVNLDGNKLDFNVSGNGSDIASFQPTFIFNNTNDPSKFGFTLSDSSKAFSNNSLTSNPLNTYYCYTIECQSGEQVCGDDGCCDINSCLQNMSISKCCDNKYSNICGTGIDRSCCPKEQVCCGNVCCEAGEICGEDGKCKIKCKYNDKDGKPIYCDPDPKGGEKVGDFCINIDPEDNSGPGLYSYCGHNDCIVNDFEPSPQNLRGSNPLAGIVLPVCSSSDGKLYSGNYQINSGVPLSRNLSISFNKELSKNCTGNDCTQLYKYYGIHSLNPTADGCDATFLCKKILDKNDKDHNNKCPFGDDSIQCCFDKGNFTGQVCQDGTISYYNGSSFDCIKGWTPIQIPSPGHGTKCIIVKGDEPNPPSKTFSKKCTPGDTYTSDCCQSACTRGFVGDNCDNVISTNDEVKILLNNMPYIVQQYSGNFENLFKELPGVEPGFFSSALYTYVLVYCINESGGRYYNYCANNSKNYWTEGTTIGGFYKTLGQDVGDLVYGDDGVGFWWNTDSCLSTGPDGPNTKYISVGSYGGIRSESDIGTGAKFFPRVYTKDVVLPNIPATSTMALGVLLIYGP